MNSRQLWNSNQRHNLRAEPSRNILRFRVSEMAFPGVFKRYLPLRMLCFFVRILVTMGTMPSKCRRHSDIAWFECFTDLNMFKYAFNVIQNWNTDALQFYSMVLIFCQQLWQKQIDESSQLRMANQPVVLAGFWPLLTALSIISITSH